MAKRRFDFASTHHFYNNQSSKFKFDNFKRRTWLELHVKVYWSWVDSAYPWWLLEVLIKLGSWIKCEENWSTFKRSLFHLLVMMIGNGLSLRSPNDETKIDCWQNNRTCSLRTSEFVQKCETDFLISVSF